MLRTLPLLVAFAAGAGCFSVDGTIERDGSGRFHLTYYINRHATVPDEKRRLTSDVVHVDALQGLGDQRATADVHVDDVTKLSSAEAFRNVQVTRERDSGAESLRFVIRNIYDAGQREALVSWARENPDMQGPRVTLSLPGPVLEANRNAETEGARVTWRVPIPEYARADRLKFRVRYAAAP